MSDSTTMFENYAQYHLTSCNIKHFLPNHLQDKFINNEIQNEFFVSVSCIGPSQFRYHIASNMARMLINKLNEQNNC
jgi:ribosomal protein S25